MRLDSNAVDSNLHAASATLAEPTYDEQMRDAMRRAPWLVISITGHAALLLVLWNIPWVTKTEKETLTLTASHLDDVPEPVIPPPPEPEVVPDVVEPDMLDPVVVEVSDSPAEEDVEVVSSDFKFPNESLSAGIIGTGGGGAVPGGGGRGGRGSGAPDASELAVLAGLEWLANHQHPDGYWDCDDFHAQCQSNTCDGRGSAMHDVGVTGLSLLAFLGANETPRHGRFRETVRSGIAWLVRQQDREDGALGPRGFRHFLYGHAIGTLALAEAYHVTHDPLLKRPAQRAVHLIQRAQNPYAAWRYNYPPDGDNDTSITGWMLFALYAARDAGLEVDDGSIKEGIAYLERMTDPSSGRTGYRTAGSYPARDAHNETHWPAEKSESLTAVSMLCRIFDGQTLESSPSLAQGADLLMRALPDHDEGAGTIDYYSWYYGTYVMWQLSGRPWDRWSRKMKEAIVDPQRTSGDEAGSWDPQIDAWGHEGGRVYATAINVLCLEVYYRYDRVLGAR